MLIEARRQLPGRSLSVLYETLVQDFLKVQ
jgi:hypothetical protein